MPHHVHTFKLTAQFGAQQVFQALQKVCGHPSQRDFAPDFTFDWVGRRVVLSASSREGLAACHEVFMGLLGKIGAEGDSLLAGEITEREDGRFERPYGVAVHDPATFGEMIGRSLMEMGLRGVQVVDSLDACRINVRMNAASRAMDYQALIAEFPLPGYIMLTDEGTRVAEERSKPRKPGAGRKNKKKR
jgi:hypothetical protein